MARQDGRPVTHALGRSRLRARAPFAILVLIVPMLAGCGLLFPGPMIGGDMGIATPGGDSMPVVIATYTTGSATLRITQSGATQEILLDRVGPASQLLSVIGAQATWRNDNGWIVRVEAFDDGRAVPGSYGQLSIDRVKNHDHWTTQDYDQSSCVVDLAEVSKKTIKGRAICTNTRWLDALGGPISLGLGAPPYIAGQAPFDAEITFQANP